MEEINIRKFQVQDRGSVRDIAWETAFIGAPASAFFSGKEILADFLTLYFTDYEPESCFVAESFTGVVGYLIGSADCLAMAQTFKKKILLRLITKFIFSKAVFRPENLRTIFSFCLSFLKGEFRMEETGFDYPATMHINLRRDFRGRGIGASLIAAFEKHLKDKGVKGVHLATMSSAAGKFFLQQGFSLLSEFRRSYFRHICGQDIIVRVLVKKL